MYLLRLTTSSTTISSITTAVQNCNGRHVVVCCSVFSVLQCVVVWCSVLQCVAVCCSVLQCVAVCCSVETTQVDAKYTTQVDGVMQCVQCLQCVAVCCSVLTTTSATITPNNIQHSPSSIEALCAGNS